MGKKALIYEVILLKYQAYRKRNQTYFCLGIRGVWNWFGNRYAFYLSVDIKTGYFESKNKI